MEKQTIKELINIIDEMIEIRQKAHKGLETRMNNYEQLPEDLTYLRIQMRDNSEKIQKYYKLKEEIKKQYEK